MSLYRRADFTDVDMFSTALCALFAAYPKLIGRQVIDPVKGLPGQLKFPPSIAEVKEALDEALVKRRTIAYRAQWMLDERKRRDAEASRKPVSAERRAQLIAELQRAMDHANIGNRKPLPTTKAEAA